ncbi:MAG: FtsB family cell division protein [Pseudonocardia sp.]
MAPEPARSRRRGRGSAAGRPTSAPGRPGGGRGGSRAGAATRAGVARSPTEAGPRSPGARPEAGRTSGAGPGVGEEIRLGRAQRGALRIGGATSGLLGVSSTRRAAVLALVVCALALSVAVPLRNFLGQRQELSRLQSEQRRLAIQVEQLEQERERLRDPAEIAEEARSRLGYARPGEIPFVVQLPNDPTTARKVVDPSAGRPWFDTLWRDVKGVPR